MPKTTVNFQKAVAEKIKLRTAEMKWQYNPTGIYQVDLVITKKDKRGDGDNFEKSILDAITLAGTVWKDDSQVKACSWKLCSNDSPSILITITEYKTIEEFNEHVI